MFEPTAKPSRGSLNWVYGQLCQGEDVALKALHRWSHRQRRPELTSNLVRELLGLTPDNIRAALRELKQPRRWIRKIGSNSLLLPLALDTLDDGRTFDIQGLLDSGATGCYLDEGFARAKGLNLEQLPRSIPIYNADGSFNEAGPIRFTTRLRLHIKDHSEVFTFAVTNLG
ncbi:hypothetical protein M378DRAFT_82671, partial [Amanita muscaria Koide BX008]